MSNYHFGDDYDLNYYPPEASDGMGGVDWDKVERVEIEFDVYVKERTCEFKPYKGPISDTDEEGNRRGVCSVCSAYMHEQFCYCPNCGARVVDR